MSKEQHPLNFFFDKIYCINLAERPDKRVKMEKRLAELGIEVEWYTAVKYGFAPKIVPPITNSKVGMFNKAQPHEFGAAMSHYTVIKKAFLQINNIKQSRWAYSTIYILITSKTNCNTSRKRQHCIPYR